MAVLNEEQEMLRDMARDWAKNESPVAEFRKVRASGEPQAYNADAYATGPTSALCRPDWLSKSSARP